MPPEPEVADATLRAASAADADRETAARLAERLTTRAPLTAEDVRAAEALFARSPVPARDLLEGVLIGAAARIAAALVPAWFEPLLYLAAAAWAGAFIGFAAIYAPLLCKPK